MELSGPAWPRWKYVEGCARRGASKAHKRFRICDGKNETVILKTQIATHDLLRVSDLKDLVCHDEAPSWVTESLEYAPYVVVRRALTLNEMAPVGVRGSQRHQRYAAYLRYDSIQERVTPEQLGREQGWLRNQRLLEIPALNALNSVTAIMDHFPLGWGPTGSVGFELASQRPTTTAASDLDLIVRAPDRISRELTRSLYTSLSHLTCRIDVHVETPYGAVSLAELMNDRGPFLRRQFPGPVLVVDPWEIYP
jgi:phosphoribosyl-dephospho-CoA transferase